jgi:CDP-2,3-bis-(O-geranylgeranyl)-sn-glycerol synthase
VFATLETAIELHPLALCVLLIVVANGAPIIARNLMGQRMAGVLDRGWVLPDGRPLFGPSKTLRGVVAAILLTAVVAFMLGLPYWLGASIGLMSMAGDLLSSFLKRRLGMAPSSMAPGLDQVPESLFPLLAARWTMGLSLVDVLLGVVLFFVIELLLSRLLYRLKIRQHPH